MSSYFDILDIPKGAGKEQVKRAFRKKAMQYHPDKNSSPEAQDMFIKVNEAYEALMEGRTMPRRKVRMKTRQEMRAEMQRKAREHAKYYAKMRYEEFRRECDAFQKSMWYWPAKFIFYSLYFALVLVASICGFGVYMAYRQFGVAGLMIFGFFLIPMAILMLAKANEFKKDLEPYFKDYD